MKEALPLGIQLGPARIADTTRIARMSRDLIEYGLDWRYTPRAIANSLRSEMSELVVARAGGRLAGFALMEFDFPRRSAHLVLMAVAPRWRRKGLASGLFRYLEKLARYGGIEDARLELRAANRGAEACYRALGFREIEVLRGYYQGREDAIRMVLRL